MSAMAGVPSRASGISFGGGGCQIRLEVLDRALNELEALVHDVEGVAEVLDFDTGSKGGANGTREGGRGTMRIAGNGANKLAGEVAEELRIWRSEQEVEHEKQIKELERILAAAVSNRRDEEADRETVRQVFRTCLYQHAHKVFTRSNTLSQNGKAPEELLAMPTVSPDASADTVAQGALAQLQAQLDSMIAPVEAFRAEVLPELDAASSALSEALKQKRIRAPAHRRRLLESIGAADADLLVEVDTTTARRKAALAAQNDRQVAILECLHEAMLERHEIFQDLDAAARAGPPSVPSSTWAALWPINAGGVRRTAVVSALGQASREMTMKNILQKGEERIEAHLADFQMKHLQTTLSQRALDADAELESWKVGAQLELLDGVRGSAEDYHNQVMKAVRAAITANIEESSLKQLNNAVANAEEFQRTKLDIIREHCTVAENSMARVVEEGMLQALSRRRRIEHCAVRRWADIKDYLDQSGAAVHSQGLLQMGEAAQRCVAESHQSLRLPPAAKDLRGLEQPMAADAVIQHWERLQTSLEQRVSFITQTLETLPDTAETCAATRALLCLLDDELRLTNSRLRDHVADIKASMSPQGGSLIPDEA